MFRRVIKVYKEEKSVKDKDTSETIASADTSQSNTPRATRQRKNRGQPVTTNVVETTTTKDDESKEKTKRKFKFEFHDDQKFIDSQNEFYVWIYEPTTIKQYVMGTLLVIGCIAVCLFPLWPSQVRTGVYYLSMILASLLGVLLSLAVIKYIIFAGVWLVTIGKIKFWLLPNLTEDVGFFESFIPLYVIDVGGKKKKTTTKDEEKESTVKEDEEEKKPVRSSTKSKSTVAPAAVATTDDDDEQEPPEDDAEEDDDENATSTSRSNSMGEVDDSNKPQKSSDEDFEVLSKDELDTK